MKITDELSKTTQVVDTVEPPVQPITSLDEVDLEKEISKLSKTNRHINFKSETLKLTTVSLLLSMSTAVSLITVIIPLGITNINLGFALKYYVIAISFQVVGVYWGMIIGLLDGFLQFIIWGMSPLFRLTSAIGLALWVFLFWLLNEKIFSTYTTNNKFRRNLGLVLGSMIILTIQPFASSVLTLFRVWIETGSQSYGFVSFVSAWISLMIFDLFAVILFATTTCRIQLIISKIWH
ncbi:hypothetical protein SCLARK_001407 [Spiroplasma clarkii]|uniref:ECF transporter S component n=1 Tax=Spiroplasma clarkii TaxID=2139 RepID=A0A1Y0L1P0_9MOLU|nr:hypothetical protein [Spiroplasma clarkii]ARU91932.1 hypothetical protein SCLARK_001407 [Spiroplasma clarkii]ATX71274.1 hypothetical protein SCLAR_v1c09720 [Spiroplasma clarkii]